MKQIPAITDVNSCRSQWTVFVLDKTDMVHLNNEFDQFKNIKMGFMCLTNTNKCLLKVICPIRFLKLENLKQYFHNPSL